MLTFWVLPAGLVKAVVGQLESDFEMMFVSGIFMVAAAVWTIMYNSDLLLRGLAFVTSRIGNLRPVLVTAVAYPMSNKFRTSLTVAMFALVIFTLMVMSVLSETFNTQFEETVTITGGWHIRGFVNVNTPISDLGRDIVDNPELRIEDFAAIGGYTGTGVQVQQLDVKDPHWEGTSVWAVDDEFLANTEHKFKRIAEGFGPTGEDVWRSLAEDPSLAVAAGFAVATREDAAGAEERDPWLQDLYYESEDAWQPVEFNVREPRTGVTTELKIIGVLDRVHQRVPNIIVSKALIDDAVPFPVPITGYQIKVADGVDSAELTSKLEAAFVEHGLETEDWDELFALEASGGRAFFRLFIGFMSLGLLVGVAGLGVVSTRAVVERRQQIGILRAIGYRRRMVHLSFMLESSFVSLLGILIGTVLGLTLGYQAFTDIRAEEALEGVEFSIPWAQIGFILAATYLFSLIATFLPSRQAARTYPAEALRYE
jgi:putative ABC transport system permease protein